ncbi:hypothetical protein Vi05172_g11430 [Venturia inaequalis]|nr:hypothetical protein Vi05172_g11430 [Venturia inaequalis]
MANFSVTNNGNSADDMSNDGRNEASNNGRNMANNNGRSMANNNDRNMNNEPSISSPLRETSKPRPLHEYHAQNTIPIQQPPQPQAHTAPKQQTPHLPLRSRTVRPKHRTASAPRHYRTDAATYRTEQEESSRARTSQRREQETAATHRAFMLDEYREEAAFIAAAVAESPLAPRDRRVQLRVSCPDYGCGGMQFRKPYTTSRR